MNYTLKQAEKALSQYSNAYGVTSVREAINRSIRSLSEMAGWECLRKVLRFSSAGPCFTLPQGYAGLVRVCVNGKPATLHGQDFRFLHSGPGDLVKPPHGFTPVNTADIRDVGISATYVIPEYPFRLFALMDSDGTATTVDPAIHVKGVGVDGKIIEAEIPLQMAQHLNHHTGEWEGGISVDDAVVHPTVFATISEVVLADDASHYITLYAEDYATERRYMISTYHPEVKVPCFRHYQVMGVPFRGPTEILAEVKIDPLPLIKDTDVLPIDSLSPIEWMIMADWKLKASEIDAAQKYQQLAAQWMKAKEVAGDTIQTPVVINNRLAGSMFEVSLESWNI